MKPLLVCDCDEVLMSFAAPFGEHLSEVHDMELHLESFALAGNIRRRRSGEAVPQKEIAELLTDFFRTGMHRQVPTPGAPAALESLSSSYDIVILTNIEDEFRGGRRDQLERYGMHYEVFCNRGPKGPALARLLADHGNPPAVFVDDLAPHLKSAAAEVPHVHRLHMIADPRLRQFVSQAEAAHARIDDWPDAEPYLRRLVQENRLARADALR